MGIEEGYLINRSSWVLAIRRVVAAEGKNRSLYTFFMMTLTWYQAVPRDTEPQLADANPYKARRYAPQELAVG